MLFGYDSELDGGVGVRADGGLKGVAELDLVEYDVRVVEARVEMSFELLESAQELVEVLLLHEAIGDVYYDIGKVQK